MSGRDGERDENSNILFIIAVVAAASERQPKEML